MTYKLLTSLFALIFWSCTVHQESENQVSNYELLEASLTELQKLGLLDINVPFNERVFHNDDFFPNSQKTPDTIAGLAVTSLEFIFTNQDGITLHSINENIDFYEIVFWDFGDRSFLVIELNFYLKVIKAERREEF